MTNNTYLHLRLSTIVQQIGLKIKNKQKNKQTINENSARKKVKDLTAQHKRHYLRETKSFS